MAGAELRGPSDEAQNRRWSSNSPNGACFPSAKQGTRHAGQWWGLKTRSPPLLSSLSLCRFWLLEMEAEGIRRSSKTILGSVGWWGGAHGFQARGSSTWCIMVQSSAELELNPMAADGATTTKTHIPQQIQAQSRSTNEDPRRTGKPQWVVVSASQVELSPVVDVQELNRGVQLVCLKMDL